MGNEEGGFALKGGGGQTSEYECRRTHRGGAVIAFVDDSVYGFPKRNTCIVEGSSCAKRKYHNMRKGAESLRKVSSEGRRNLDKERKD